MKKKNDHKGESFLRKKKKKWHCRIGCWVGSDVLCRSPLRETETRSSWKKKLKKMSPREARAVMPAIEGVVALNLQWPCRLSLSSRRRWAGGGKEVGGARVTTPFLGVLCCFRSMQTFTAQRCSRSWLEVKPTTTAPSTLAPPRGRFYPGFPSKRKVASQTKNNKKTHTAWEWQASAQLCTGETGQ